MGSLGSALNVHESPRKVGRWSKLLHVVFEWPPVDVNAQPQIVMNERAFVWSVRRRMVDVAEILQ